LILDRLERVVAAVDLRNGGRGIVVIATPDRASACLVPFPVTEGVAVGAAATMRALLSTDGNRCDFAVEERRVVGGVRGGWS
jgi:hypothetical protein